MTEMKNKIEEKIILVSQNAKSEIRLANAIRVMQKDYD